MKNQPVINGYIKFDYISYTCTNWQYGVTIYSNLPQTEVKWEQIDSLSKSPTKGGMHSAALCAQQWATSYNYRTVVCLISGQPKFIKA